MKKNFAPNRVLTLLNWIRHLREKTGLFDDTIIASIEGASEYGLTLYCKTVIILSFFLNDINFSDCDLPMTRN